MSDNLSAFRAGIMKFQKEMDNQMQDNTRVWASQALYDAVNEWNDAYSLTGNLENSYAAGIYAHGRLIDMYYAHDVDESIDEAYDTYAIPGKYRWVWPERENHDDPGMKVFIRQYKKGLRFQKVTEGKYGAQDAYEFLNSYHANKKCWEVVVVVAAPYAEYLMNVRKLNVIQNSYKKAQGGVFVKDIYYTL